MQYVRRPASCNGSSSIADHGKGMRKKTNFDNLIEFRSFEDRNGIDGSQKSTDLYWKIVRLGKVSQFNSRRQLLAVEM